MLDYSVYKSGCELAILVHTPNEGRKPHACNLVIYDAILKKNIANFGLATLFDEADPDTTKDFLLMVQCIDVTSAYQLIVLGISAKSKYECEKQSERGGIAVFHLDQRSLKPACSLKVFETLELGISHVKWLESSKDGIPRYVAADFTGQLALVSLKEGQQTLDRVFKVHEAAITYLLVSGLDIFTASLDKTVTKTKIRPEEGTKSLLHN